MYLNEHTEHMTSLMPKSKIEQRSQTADEMELLAEFSPRSSKVDSSIGLVLDTNGRLPGLPTKIQFGVEDKDYDYRLFFPARIPAFGLKEKKWGWVLVDHLTPITWNETAFNALQFNPGTKKLLKKLVTGHATGKISPFDDVVPGKGKGLLVLLQGYVFKLGFVPGLTDALKRTRTRKNIDCW
jgi:hypothetical protein